MFLKFIVAGAVLLVLWMVLFRATGPARRVRTERPRKPLSAQDLSKCGSCGIYLPAGQTCDCADRA